MTVTHPTPTEVRHLDRRAVNAAVAIEELHDSGVDARDPLHQALVPDLVESAVVKASEARADAVVAEVKAKPAPRSKAKAAAK